MTEVKPPPWGELVFLKDYICHVSTHDDNFELWEHRHEDQKYFLVNRMTGVVQAVESSGGLVEALRIAEAFILDPSAPIPEPKEVDTVTPTK